MNVPGGVVATATGVAAASGTGVGSGSGATAAGTESGTRSRAEITSGRSPTSPAAIAAAAPIGTLVEAALVAVSVLFVCDYCSRNLRAFISVDRYLTSN